MNNPGKIFETNFKKSVPDYALLYRLPDAAQSFSHGTNLRFSRKNPFDFILWDSENRVLYALELKTVKGNSISFERSKSDTGEIHYHQVIGLKEWDRYEGTTCGFIIDFRESDKCIFISISEYDRLINLITKKSFNLKDLEQNHVSYCVIGKKKLRTQYRYDVEALLKGVLNEQESTDQDTDKYEPN